MSRQNTIQPFLALLVLILFTFSITPRKTLHEIFGCHQDTSSHFSKIGDESLSNQAFHCSCEQPELQAPFIQVPVIAGFSLPDPSLGQYLIPFCTPLHDSTTVFSKLRGPPGNA